MSHPMLQPRRLQAVTAIAAAPVVQEKHILRDARLLASDGGARFIVSDGGSGVTHFVDASDLVSLPKDIDFQECHSTDEAQANAPVSTSFICAAPDQGASNDELLAASAEDCNLRVFKLLLDPACPMHCLGVLSSATRWLGACWHPEWTGLLAAICQAELRVTLCDAVDTSSSGKGAAKVDTTLPTDSGRSNNPSGAHERATSPTPIHFRASRLHPISSLAPPHPRSSHPARGSAPPPDPAPAPGPCRSTQCHVAWVGGHGLEAGGESPPDTLTLVAAWGADMELTTWSGAEVRSRMAGSSCVVAGDGGGGGGGDGGGPAAPLLAPTSRRVLLLGVPGPLSALTQGPYGSVLATTDVGLALPTSQLHVPAGEDRGGAAAASGRGGQDGAAGGSSRGSQAGSRNSSGEEHSRPGPNGIINMHQPQPASPPEVIDLRGGRLAPAAGIQASSEGAFGAGPTLAGLFNVARLGQEEGLFGGSRLAGSGRPAAAVPATFLLHGAGSAGAGAAASAAASSAALCVVWPGRLASQASPGPDSKAAPGFAAGALPAAFMHKPLQFPIRNAHPTGTAAAHGSQPVDGTDEDGFCSVAPLPLPRPDLLCCCGSLVLAASSLGPPVVAAFGLAPLGGLTHLATVSPSVPGTIDPARGRLRGLAAVLPRSGCARRGWPSWTADGAAPSAAGAVAGLESAVMLVMVGEPEQAAAGGGIVGFSRFGRPAGQRLAPLVVSAHPLPAPLARHAAAAAAAASVAARAHPGVSSSGRDDNRAQAAAAGATLSVPQGAAPDSVGVCVQPAASAAAAATVAHPGRTSPNEPTDGSTDALTGAVVRELFNMLDELRGHMDRRFDDLASSLQAVNARLDHIESAMEQQLLLRRQ